MRSVDDAVPRYPDLEGKVAVVTGGSQGIGAATSRRLADNGVKVAVAARRREPVEDIVAAIRANGGEAIGVSCDATQRDSLDALCVQVEREFGPPDIVVPFAGGFTSFTPIAAISEAEWRHVIDWNLTSTFLTVQTFLPRMIERRSGVIVTMASQGARVLDKPLTASYVAAKAAVVMYTRHIAMELGDHGIRANAIAPGTVLTERVARIMDDDAVAMTAALSPLGRMGTPEDCAQATLFLASDVASWVTGVTMDVSGGRVMV